MLISFLVQLRQLIARNNSTLGAVKSVREVWYAHVCGNEAFIHCMNTDAIPCTVAIDERGIRTEQLE